MTKRMKRVHKLRCAQDITHKRTHMIDALQISQRLFFYYLPKTTPVKALSCLLAVLICAATTLDFPFDCCVMTGHSR